MQTWKISCRFDRSAIFTLSFRGSRARLAQYERFRDSISAAICWDCERAGICSHCDLLFSRFCLFTAARNRHSISKPSAFVLPATAEARADKSPSQMRRRSHESFISAPAGGRQPRYGFNHLPLGPKAYSSLSRPVNSERVERRKKIRFPTLTVMESRLFHPKATNSSFKSDFSSISALKSEIN